MSGNWWEGDAVAGPQQKPAGNWWDSDPVAGAEPNKPAGGLAAAAKQAIGAGIKGAGQIATDFLPGVSSANPVSAYGQSVIDANPTAINSLGDIVDSPWTATKEAVGNAAGSMGSMLGARALGMGITAAAPFTGPAAPVVAGAGQLIANVGPFVAAALPSYGGIRESQIKADPTNEADGKSKAIALLGAGAVGAIESAYGPQAWALAAMKKGGIEAIAKQFADAKSLPGAIGKGILKGGAIEGAEELVQNPIEQVAGYQDPTTRQAIGETLFGGAMGAIGGGVLGGGMAGVAYRQPDSAQTHPPAVDPVADPIGTLSDPQAGPIAKAAATGVQSGAVQQAQQAQAAVTLQTQSENKEATNEKTNPDDARAQGASLAQDAGTGEAPIQAASAPGAAGLARYGDNPVGVAAAPQAPPATFPIEQQAIAAPIADTTQAVPVIAPQPPTIEGISNGTQAQEAKQAAPRRPAQPATASNAAGVAFTTPAQPTTNAGPLPQQSVAMPVKDALSGERISGAKDAPTNKQSLSVAPTTSEGSRQTAVENPQLREAPKTAPAIAEPAIDVSTRTDKQLAYLSTNGRTGYKEAAIEEIARRVADNNPAQTPATAGDSVLLSSGQGKETGGSLPKPTLAERKAEALERRKAKESGGISGDEKQKLLDKKQLYSDMMETKAANGEKIPEQWKVSLSEIDAKLRGDSVGEHVFSLVVEGHPMFDGFPILRNLVPIKVDSFSEAERKLFSAQDLYSKIAGERAKAAHAKAIAKTVAQKKAAIAAMQKLDNNGATEDAVETLRSVTIPELQRIAKEAEQKFGASNVANDKAKEAATKAAEARTIAARSPEVASLADRLKAAASSAVGSRKAALEARLARLEAASDPRTVDADRKADLETRKRMDEKPAGVSSPESRQSPIQKRDDLIGAIMRVTGGNGIHSSMALDTTGDDASKSPNLRGLFTPRGTIDLGDTAGLLRTEEGYDVRDGEHLADLIRQAAGGDVPVSMERQERDKDADKERRHRDRIRAQAKKYGVKVVGVKFSVVEGRVLFIEQRRHEKAVELLSDRDKARFDAAVAQSEGIVSDDEIQAILNDVAERGITGRDAWQEALVLQRQLAEEARFKQEQGALEDAEDRATSEEPDWFKDFDDEADSKPGNEGTTAASDDFTLEQQSIADADRQEAERVAAEKAARESAEKAAREEKAKANKAEKDRRAADVLKEREAAKKAEVDAAADAFELGQDAPAPVVKKVTIKDATGQKDIFGDDDPAIGLDADSLAIGDEVRFVPHSVSSLTPEISGSLIGKESTGGGRFRLRIQSADGATTQVYSQNGTVGKAAKDSGPVDPPMKKGERFTDGDGKLWEVWTARTGLIEAHPVENGKPVVNRDSGVRFATTSIARSANPEARTDFTPIATAGEADSDRFGAPADASPKLTTEIPPSIKGRVQHALSRLRDAEQALEDVERARGKGHFLALEVRDQQGAINAARATLDEFRKMAPDNNVDADAVIANLGGEPDFERFGKPADEASKPTAEGGKQNGEGGKSAVEGGKTTAEAAPAKARAPEAKVSEGTKVDLSDEKPGDIRYNVAADSGPSSFFSPLERAIDSARIAAQPAAQWKAWITGNAGNLGVKKDEIEWSGILDYLDVRGKDKVTKAEIADYLSGNGVKVQDVVRGSTPPMSVEDEYRFTELMAVPYEQRSNHDIEWMESRRESATDNKKPKFADFWDSSYKGGIPGTYREILVTLPEKQDTPLYESLSARYGKRGRSLYLALTKEEKYLVDAESARIKVAGQSSFRSNHWDEPNVLVHIRTDEVIGADGKRYLRVGEIQSDWGQKGKKEGFGGTIDAVLKYNKMTRAEFDSMPKSDQAFAIEETKRAGMAPSAPFVTDTRAWAALGIKRAIIHAINSGVDGVVLGTGEQNANLYDLSKQVQSIEWTGRGNDSEKLVTITVKSGNDIEFRLMPDGTTGSISGEQSGNEFAGKRLDDIVGKDISDRIMSAPYGDVRGDGLKVGGEGMRAFYDRIVPSVANDVLKKVGGGKIEPVSVRVSSANAWMSVKKPVSAYDSQPGFLITPEMRAKIQTQGMPLFNRPNTDTLSTPADRAVYGMVADGKSSAEVLSFISKASRRPFNRVLASHLARIGVTPNITLDSQGGWQFGNTSRAQRYAAAYNPKTDTVALFTPRDAERHALHEMVHAATLKAIAAGGPASVQMRALFIRLKRTKALAGQYGMSSIDEFVAEAFSNPKFQQALKAIPAPAGSGLKSAWHWFVRAVARILGLRTPAMETALDRAMTLGAQLMRENASLLERNGEKLDAIRESDAVRYSADGMPDTITVDGVERPTTNSNGHPIAQDEAGVRRFYEWFGNSTVTDAQGRPLVVYHGAKEEFSEFDLDRAEQDVDGIWLTDTGGYASWVASGGPGGKDRGVVMDLYLRAESPMIFDVLEEGRSIADRLGEPAPETSSEAQEIIAGGIGWDTAVSDLVREAKSSGNDALIITSFNDGFMGVKVTTTAYVAFDAAQIKSATGENNEFSPDNPDIRYNIATDWISNPTISNFVDNATRSDKSTSIITPFNTQYHKAHKWAAEGKPWFKRVFDMGQKFLSDTSRFAVMAQDAAPALFHEVKSLADAKTALRNIKSFGDLTGATHRKDIDAAASPLYEGTLYGGGNPMSGIVFSDSKLRHTYKLTDRQIRLYREALAAVNVSLDEMAKSIIARHAKQNDIDFNSDMDIDDMADAVIEAIEDRKDDLEYSVGAEMEGEAKATAENLRDMDRPEEAKKTLDAFNKRKDAAASTVARLDKTIADIKGVVGKNKRLQEHGYFPLMRFGKHTVTAKDAEGNTAYFGMFDGIPMVPQSGQYQANKVAAAIRAEHPEWEVTTGIHNTEKYKLYEGMNLEAVQLFAEHMDKDSLEPFQEFLRLATGDRSVLKRLVHRQGTPGFDRDVRRTLAQFIVSNARHTSSSYNLFDMRKAAESANADGGDIGAEAVKLYKYVAEPTEEAHQLRAFLFFNFLGGSIASAMVNLSQVPMMTFPYLTQYESAGKLANRLRLAARTAIGDPAKIPGTLGAALVRAEQDGVTAPQEIHQLTATAANSIFSGNPAMTGLLRFWGMPFSMAESFNRRTTFIAAFQIAESMTPAQLAATGTKSAFEFAERAVKDTQGIYNKGNRMNVGRGAVGATMMTFKQFSIMYLELLKRLPRNQQLLMLGIMTLAAGAGGWPFAEDVEDIIDTFGQWLGFGTNSKRWVRNTLAGATSPQIADILLNGAASQMGIDLHSRLGTHNLLPGSGVLKQSSTDKWRDASEFFGPAASVLQNAATALQEMATGHAGRAVKAMAPVAAQNAIKGYDMASTGYAEDSKGRRTIPVSGPESAAKGIGFNPKAVADFGVIKRDIAQDTRMLSVKREEFTSAIADAILSGDMEARKDALAEMAKWNEDNPKMRVVIAPGAVIRRVRAARMEGADRFLKAVPKTMRADSRQELAQP